MIKESCYFYFAQLLFDLIREIFLIPTCEPKIDNIECNLTIVHLLFKRSFKILWNAFKSSSHKIWSQQSEPKDLPLTLGPNTHYS